MLKQQANTKSLPEDMSELVPETLPEHLPGNQKSMPGKNGKNVHIVILGPKSGHYDEFEFQNVYQGFPAGIYRGKTRTQEPNF